MRIACSRRTRFSFHSTRGPSDFSYGQCAHFIVVLLRGWVYLRPWRRAGLLMLRYHHVLLFVLGLILGSCKAPTPAAAPLTAAFAEVPQASPTALEYMTVALVKRTDANEIKAYCSGVWVSRTVILTANHCITRHGEEPIEYLVYRDVYPSDKGYSENYPLVPRIGAVVSSDLEHDLALIRTPEAPSSHPCAQLRALPVLVGGSVQTVGHSMGLWYSYSSGVVAAVRYTQLFDDETSSLVVQSPIPISPGNSGGGLFDGRGELVGVTHGTYLQGQGVNLFIHVRYVRALLEGVEP